MATENSEHQRHEWLDQDEATPPREPGNRYDNDSDQVGLEADDDREAHCHDRTNAEAYRAPKEHEKDLDPCRFCFPNEEIHVDESDLLVSHRRKSDKKLHRDEETEGEEWSPDRVEDSSFANALRSDDVTSIEDLADALEEGDD